YGLGHRGAESLLADAVLVAEQRRHALGPLACETANFVGARIRNLLQPLFHRRNIFGGEIAGLSVGAIDERLKDALAGVSLREPGDRADDAGPGLEFGAKSLLAQPAHVGFADLSREVQADAGAAGEEVGELPDLLEALGCRLDATRERR